MNERPLIDHHQAIKGLRLAVADRGVEYIDPHAQSGGCRYVLVTEEPGCIAATALFKLGVSLDELRQWEGSTAKAMVPGAPTVGLRNRGTADGIITRQAGLVLREAQAPQDKGFAWGICLLDAEDMYRLIVEEEQA